MDPIKYMIIDLKEKGGNRRFLTEQVAHISENNNGLWTVKFTTSQRIFNYNKSRLLYLTNPTNVDLIEKGLYIKNKHITNVSKLLKFDDGKHLFYYVVYKNGFSENVEGNEVYVTRTPINKNCGSIWEYLNKLAAETGLISEEGDNILALQYGIIDIMRDNVPLAQYLGDKTKLTTFRTPTTIFYPFGCNASQKKAVENALTNQVSIIQGPPGTGKTQTILNIIANLLLANKSVLVVSNNNSAVENVAEKMEKEGLGFLVAKLGSVENKELFVANQQEYPKMDNWKFEEVNSNKLQITQALKDISLYFEGQTKYALLKSELDQLLKETKYDIMRSDVSDEHKWLFNKSSKKLLSIRFQYGILMENGKNISQFKKIKWSFSLGFKIYKLLKSEPQIVINAFEAAYYVARKRELEKELLSIEKSLKTIDLDKKVADLRHLSLKALKCSVAKRFTGERKRFTLKSIKPKTEDFLREYPVVLSTTYSAKVCISKEMVFDYLIMDEASQVDIKTGALALSCALNAVIVGDDKQLPNVVSKEEQNILNVIESTYQVDIKYKATANSFLQSCVKVFTDAPVTLLREHYRCHPRIIDFCNQRFYNGELIAMTKDCKEDKVLQVIKTVPGNHARGHFNQREIDVIQYEVMPEYSASGSVGIITPYRDQAKAINKALGKDVASTVHKFQGRECDTIIMSMVDNVPTDFSDDPNLMNVAISRAKTRLCVVVNGNDMPINSNLAQLISYIQYNNFEVKESKIHSVFDILYKQYTKKRLEYEAINSKVSNYLSENLIYDILVKAINKIQMTNWSVVCHYPLSRLITDFDGLSAQEIGFISNSLSHVDFLIYNSITKRPLMAIEVDGWKYHNQSEVQQSRDKLKDDILTKYGLKPYRISTVDTINVETIANMLLKVPSLLI